ncbi:MAG: SIMPL domain-containing protein [bacterium]|nr:SIMPL domain-containing protein [bacterium]
MKRLKWLLLIGTLVFGAVTSVSAQETGGDRQTITVSGIGSAAGEPDVAYVELGVESVNADLSTAFSDTSTQMTALIDALIAYGIAREDIQTTLLNVYQEDIYDPNTGQATGETRDHVQNFIRITVRSVESVGELVSQAVDAGANRVINLSFGILDLSVLEGEARTQAVANARERAAQLAGQFGLEVGDVLHIRETIGSAPVTAFGFGGMRAEAQAMPVEGGQLQVSVQVEITFTLVNG